MNGVVNDKPLCWVRTKDGKLDWSEDCLGTSREDVLDGWSDRDQGYDAIPLYTTPSPLQVPTWRINEGKACEVCKHPVYAPTALSMGPAMVFGDRVWHSHCFPPGGVSGTFTTGGNSQGNAG